MDIKQEVAQQGSLNLQRLAFPAFVTFQSRFQERRCPTLAVEDISDDHAWSSGESLQVLSPMSSLPGGDSGLRSDVGKRETPAAEGSEECWASVKIPRLHLDHIYFKNNRGGGGVFCHLPVCSKFGSSVGAAATFTLTGCHAETY